MEVEDKWPPTQAISNHALLHLLAERKLFIKTLKATARQEEVFRSKYFQAQNNAYQFLPVKRLAE